MKFKWAFLIPVCVAALIGGVVVARISIRSVPNDSPTSFPTYYQSISELARASDLVVHAVAGKNATTIKYHGDLTVTITPVSIKQVLRGSGGSTLTQIHVVEEGGLLEGKRLGNVMESGKDYVLFLGKSPSDPELPADTYKVRGSYMGKFGVMSDGTLQFTGPTQDVQGLLAEIKHMKLADLPSKMPR